MGISAMAESYSTVALSYDYTEMKANHRSLLTKFGYEGKDKKGAFNGLGVQYNYGIGISNLPMNVEVGLKFNVGFLGKTLNSPGSQTTDNSMLMRLSVPVSYIYHFNFKKVTVSPYAGLDFRFNLLAQTKSTTTTFIYNGETEKYEVEKSDPVTKSYFSKEDVANETANRFQAGWHLGVRVGFGSYFVGIEGGTDFNPFWNVNKGEGKINKDKITTGNLAVSVGYKF